MQRACKVCRARQAKKRRASGRWNVQATNIRNRLARYGLSEEQYNQMLADQANRCAICQQPPPEALASGRRQGLNSLHIDHCHRTGRVRQLLCHHCNKGIGHMKDDVNRLLAAVSYLLRHQELPRAEAQADTSQAA